MNQLSTLMQHAAGDPPPTTIDLDSLIGRELRRRDRVRWLAAGTSAVAVAAIATTATVVPHLSVGGVAAVPSATCVAVRHPSSQTHASMSPRTPPGGDATFLPNGPTEPAGAAVDRLSRALAAALPVALPGRTFADDLHVNCPSPRFQPDVYPAKYYASVRVADAAGPGTIVIMLSPTQYPALDVYDQHRTLGDGTQVGWFAETVNPDGAPEPTLAGVQISVLRPDGTYLMLLAQNVTGANYDVITRPTSPATVDELITIAAAPGLTLFP